MTDSANSLAKYAQEQLAQSQQETLHGFGDMYETKMTLQGMWFKLWQRIQVMQ